MQEKTITSNIPTIPTKGLRRSKRIRENAEKDNVVPTKQLRKSKRIRHNSKKDSTAPTKRLKRKKRIRPKTKKYNPAKSPYKRAKISLKKIPEDVKYFIEYKLDGKFTEINKDLRSNNENCLPCCRAALKIIEDGHAKNINLPIPKSSAGKDIICEFDGRGHTKISIHTTEVPEARQEMVRSGYCEDITEGKVRTILDKSIEPACYIVDKKPDLSNLEKAKNYYIEKNDSRYILYFRPKGYSDIEYISKEIPKELNPQLENITVDGSNLRNQADKTGLMKKIDDLSRYIRISPINVNAKSPCYLKHQFLEEFKKQYAEDKSYCIVPGQNNEYKIYFVSKGSEAYVQKTLPQEIQILLNKLNKTEHTKNLRAYKQAVLIMEQVDNYILENNGYTHFTKETDLIDTLLRQVPTRTTDSSSLGLLYVEPKNSDKGHWLAWVAYPTKGPLKRRLCIIDPQNHEVVYSDDNSSELHWTMVTKTAKAHEYTKPKLFSLTKYYDTEISYLLYGNNAKYKPIIKLEKKTPPIKYTDYAKLKDGSRSLDLADIDSKHPAINLTNNNNKRRRTVDLTSSNSKHPITDLTDSDHPPDVVDLTNSDSQHLSTNPTIDASPSAFRKRQAAPNSIFDFKYPTCFSFAAHFGSCFPLLSYDIIPCQCQNMNVDILERKDKSLAPTPGITG